MLKSYNTLKMVKRLGWRNVSEYLCNGVIISEIDWAAIGKLLI